MKLQPSLRNPESPQSDRSRFFLRKFGLRLSDFILLLGLLTLAAPRLTRADRVSQLGPVGGTFETVPDNIFLSVVSVTPGGPGAAAGLQAGDLIYGAFGEVFTALSSDTKNGYKGSVQDYGEAIERAESGNVPLALKVLRPGTGGLTVSVTLPNVGAFGAAYPLGSPKFDALYEWACAQMHEVTMELTNADSLGYIDGWFGFCLLAHPNWNDLAGPKPYRLSINKLRDWAVTRLNAAILEPLERNQPGYVDPSLENWFHASSAMFLAEYRRKSGDASVNATIQRAAELLANRVQYWRQPDEGNGFTPNVPGVMGHGGVVGDYLHAYYVGLNIINVHAGVAMGLLQQAGANFNGLSGTTAGTAPIAYTFAQRARLSWEFLKQCTELTGDDAGNVGYAGTQGNGYDSGGRTAGAIATFKLFNFTPTGDDTAKLNLMLGYLPRQWQRLQHCHAYTAGGVGMYQLALPFLVDRDQRFIMENTRFFYHLHRTSSGTLEYFGGRDLNDGDGYLDYLNVAAINVAIAKAIASGNLPSFPLQNPARLYARMVRPWVKWPTQAAHTGNINAATATLEVEVADYLGAPVTSGLSATWSSLSGPGTVNFGNANALTTTATFSADGVYRLQLVASKGGYTLTEPYDFTVVRNPITPPDPVAPAVTVHPVSLTRTLGGSATFSVTATGDGPLAYLWRLNGVSYWPASATPSLALPNIGGGLAGSYDCVVTGPGGATTSASATLTISDAGAIVAGGLWREKYSGINGLDVSDLTGARTFPRFPDASAAIPSAEDAGGGGDDYGQRWTGWLKPTATGDYQFYLTGDDSAELWLSATDQPAGRVLIVSLPFWGNARRWSAGRRSANIPLVAGQRYYLELLHKNAGGGDHVAFTWRRPGDPVPADGSPAIGTAFLEYRRGGEHYDPTTPVPTVTLTTPSNGATFNAPATINFSASVTANGHMINSVRYYNGASLLGSATVAPYNFAWTSVPAGAYTVSAEVVYGTTQTLSSAPAFITVQGGATPPTTTTLPATAVANNTATLNGTINPNGTATTGYFEWGYTASYGQTTAVTNLGNGSSPLPLSATLNWLIGGQTFHYRAVGSNAVGAIVYGGDQTFTTPLTFNPPVRTFTGGDAGEGLDLQGAFPYAFTVGGASAPGLIGDAAFTTDNVAGVSITASSGAVLTVPNWVTRNYGATVNDDRLELAMTAIRYTTAPAKLTVTLGALQAGRSYKLQLLFTEFCCDRAFDVKVNGVTVMSAFRLLDYGFYQQPLVITHTFTAAGTSAVIELGDGTPAGLDGNPTLSALTLEDGGVAPACAGNALNLSGGYAETPHAADLNAYPLTLTAWIKTTSAEATAEGVVNKYFPGSQNGYQLYLSGGHIYAFYYKSGSDSVSGQDGGLVNDGQWHHLAYTVDTNGGSLYVDGVLRSSRAWTGTPGAPTTAQPLRLGNYELNANFLGQLDEVTVWNVARSPAQLQATMTNSLAGREAGLIAYYRANDATGPLTDSAPGGTHPAALVGSAHLAASTAPIYCASGSQPITLIGATQLPNGTFQFRFTGVTATPYTVLASTSLALPLNTWSNLGLAVEAPAGSGQFLFTDPQASNFPQRFYQVRTP